MSVARSLYFLNILPFMSNFNFTLSGVEQEKVGTDKSLKIVILVCAIQTSAKQI